MTAEGRTSGVRCGRAGPARRGGRSAADRKLAIGLLAAGVVAFAASAAGLAALFAARPAELWSMLDLQVYVWAGHTARLTGTPYQGTYESFNLYFTYPPIAAAVFEVLSLMPLAVVKWLITSASVVSLAAVTWLSWGKLGYRRSLGRLGATLLVAAIVLWLEPVQQTLAFGQVNIVLMLIVMADLCLPDRNWLKGAGIGLAAGFKLTPLIFIPYLLVTRRYQAAGVAAGTFALTIAVSSLLLPRAAAQFWTGRLYLSVSRVGNVAFVGNQSLYAAALRLFGSASAAHPYWLAAAALTGLAGLFLAAWLSRRGEDLAGIVTCALTGLLISPVSWSHHWVWIAPALVAVTELAVRAGRAVQRPVRLRADWLAVTVSGLAVIAVLALYIAYPVHAAPGAPRLPAGLIWTIPSPAVQGTGMTGYQELIGNLYVLAGLVSLAAVACWVLAHAPVRAPHAYAGQVAGGWRGPFRRRGQGVPSPVTTVGSSGPPPPAAPATGSVPTMSEALAPPPPPPHSPSGPAEPSA
jgi:alpha-1,2-mannosyltransferase